MTIAGVSARTYEILRPPTLRECPALGVRRDWNFNRVDRRFLAHLEDTHQRSSARFAESVEASGIPREHWGNYLVIGNALGDGDFHHVQNGYAVEAVCSGISHYFEDPEHLADIHDVGIINAITEFVNVHPQARGDLIYHTVENIRRTRFTPYSKKVNNDELAKFFSSQKRAIIDSPLHRIAKNLALNALEQARENPDQMDTYADVVFLIQSLDFAGRVPGVKLRIHKMWDAKMKRLTNRGWWEDEEEKSVIEGKFFENTDVENEVWKKVEAFLKAGLDISDLYYELEFAPEAMRPEDNHIRINMIQAFSQRMDKTIWDIPQRFFGGKNSDQRWFYHDDEPRVNTIRFFPPSLQAKFIKASHPLFDGFIYQSEEATPAEIVDGYLQYRTPIGLFWGDIPFKDYNPNPMVPPFYFTSHDIYHAADKILSSMTISDAVAPLWLALSELPEDVILTPGMQAVIRLFLDLEISGFQDFDEFVQKNYFKPLREYYLNPEVRDIDADPDKFYKLWDLLKNEDTSDIMPAVQGASKKGLIEYRDLLNQLILALQKHSADNRQAEIVLEEFQAEVKRIEAELDNAE